MFMVFTCNMPHIIQMCSGIIGGRVLNGELYAQRFQKLIYLPLSTDCFMKISTVGTNTVYSIVLAPTIQEKSS